jgi:hypothetical protein
MSRISTIHTSIIAIRLDDLTLNIQKILCRNDSNPSYSNNLLDYCIWYDAAQNYDLHIIDKLVVLLL